MWVRRVVSLLLAGAILSGAVPAAVDSQRPAPGSGSGTVATDPLPPLSDVGFPGGAGGPTNRAKELLYYRGSAAAPLTYLIVAPTTFQDTGVSLATWKTQKGLNAGVVTVDQIRGVYPGIDDAQKIHNFLRALRAEEPQLKWLLLLGDTQWVPVRHMWSDGSTVDPSYIRDSVPSDFYYAALDTTWDVDGDQVWGRAAGEQDWQPDLYVGRIPVDTNAEASKKVGDILRYEKTPAIGPWMRTATLVSALYDTPNLIDDSKAGIDDGYYQYWQDNGKEAIDIAAQAVPPWMAQQQLHDYNETYGGNYTAGNDTLSQGSFVSAFNGGSSFMISATHGWISGNGPIHYGGNGSETPGSPEFFNRYRDFYSYTDAQAASNGERLNFWYASSCVIGNWSESAPERTMEQFWKNMNGGVIGMVAATHGDYRGELGLIDKNISDGDWWLLETYAKIFFNQHPVYKGDYRPGQTLYLDKWAYVRYLTDDLGYGAAAQDEGFSRQSKLVYNLMGDPEVPIWTNVPATLSVAAPASVSTGSVPFTVTVTDAVSGLPVPDARVAAWSPQLHASGLTDAQGKVTLTVVATAAHGVNLTVTAHNYLPAMSTFQITWRPADLTIDPANIVPTERLVKTGNPVTIAAVVDNIGEVAVSSVDVAFFDGDPFAGGREIGR